MRLVIDFVTSIRMLSSQLCENSPTALINLHFKIFHLSKLTGLICSIKVSINRSKKVIVFGKKIAWVVFLSSYCQLSEVSKKSK